MGIDNEFECKEELAPTNDVIMSELEPLESEDRHRPLLTSTDHSAWLENSFHLLERMESEHSAIPRNKQTSFDERKLSKCDLRVLKVPASEAGRFVSRKLNAKE